jgi:hypothetical protein
VSKRCPRTGRQRARAKGAAILHVEMIVQSISLNSLAANPTLSRMVLKMCVCRHSETHSVQHGQRGQRGRPQQTTEADERTTRLK